MQVSPDPSQGLIVHRRKPRCRALHTQPQGDISGRKLGQGRQLTVNRARSTQHDGKEARADDQHHQRHRGPAGQTRTGEVRLQLRGHLIELGHGDHPARINIADGRVDLQQGHTQRVLVFILGVARVFEIGPHLAGPCQFQILRQRKGAAHQSGVRRIGQKAALTPYLEADNAATQRGVFQKRTDPGAALVRQVVGMTKVLG